MVEWVTSMQSKRIFSERLLGILVGKITAAIFDFYSSRRLGRKRHFVPKGVGDVQKRRGKGVGKI